MTISWEVKVDEVAVKDAMNLFEFVGGNTAQAIRIAINKAGPKIRTLASRRIRDQVRLNAAYVRERLLFDRATPWDLSGRITTTHRGMLMPRYSTDSAISGSTTGGVGKVPATPPKGIRVKVKTSGAVKIFKGGKETDDNKPFFMVLKSSGALGIVARFNGVGPRGGKIKAYYGPSLSQVFGTVRDDILPQASQEFQAQLIDAMRYVLVKKYPPEATA